MKKLKSILSLSVLALLFVTGCEDSITSSGDKNYSANETEFQSDQIALKVYNNVINVAPGETVAFGAWNLPMSTFSHFKIKDVTYISEIDVCNYVSYWYQIGRVFNLRLLECMSAGEEIEELKKEMLSFGIKNNTESVMKFEITISE